MKLKIENFHKKTSELVWAGFQAVWEGEAFVSHCPEGLLAAIAIFLLLLDN
jgi:hypothetical protein